jgi:hypothetical protein
MCKRATGQVTKADKEGLQGLMTYLWDNYLMCAAPTHLHILL